MKRLGFDRWSALTIALFVAVCGTMSLVFRDYVQFDDADPLLMACWAGMVLLTAWRVDPRKDAILALVALVGGALIETWGTHAGLWTYFNGERPPPFILPAWPAAAVATERAVRLFTAATRRSPPRLVSAIHAIAMTAVVLLVAAWAKPGAHHPLTWIAAACVIATLASGRLAGEDARIDLARLGAGALIGFPLELWGTTSECWVYHSGGTPPFQAVLAHGFATVAFGRGASLVVRAIALRGSRQASRQKSQLT